MDEINFDPKPRRGRKLAAAMWNVLTLIILIITVFVVRYFVVVYNNPYSNSNLFPPPTVPAKLSLPTSTPTSLVILPASWTPTIALEPTLTETPRPSSTLAPTSTSFTIVTAPPTLKPTKPPLGYPFVLQRGSPVAVANIYHPEWGCNWMGVGGQVVDMNGDPLLGLIIKLSGALTGVHLPEHMTSLTGVALNYGRAGFEFTLADHPIASKGTLWLQLLDQSLIPISDKVYFDTYESCEKNLIIVNFKRIK
jgi:hypothetical protein